jgi:hypothetical protein
MPHPFQAGAGEHPTYRLAAGRSDQTNDETTERPEGRSGEARPEHREQGGQRNRYRAVGKHRRITLTRVVQTPSMLSSSHSKIHEPPVTACRHRRPADAPVGQELRNTRARPSRATRCSSIPSAAADRRNPRRPRRSRLSRPSPPISPGEALRQTGQPVAVSARRRKRHSGKCRRPCLPSGRGRYRNAQTRGSHAGYAHEPDRYRSFRRVRCL